MKENTIKTNIKINNEGRCKATLTQLQNLNENQKCLNEMTQEKEVSNWLMAYPIRSIVWS